MAAASAPLSLRYHSDQMVTKVTSGLQDFYLSGHFCDIILNVGALKIRAHRVVLAAFSPYFRDLFLQPTSKQCSEITLRPHLKEEAVRQLIDFCYSSDITVDSQSADKILTVANFLQVKEVEKLCITFLAAQQALKPEVSPPLVSPHQSMQVPTTQSSPQQDKAKGDNSNQVVCADTSGIGSNQTSPRHSSRPSSVPSGSGSVFAQPIEDGDSGQTEDDRQPGVIEVKKEQEDGGREPTFLSTPSSASVFHPEYDALRTSMSGFSGFYFPPTASALNMPRLPIAQTLSVGSQHLLMKALTHSVSSPPDIRDLGEMYNRYIGLTPGMVKDENANLSSAEGSPILVSEENNHQCHVCLKVYSSLSDLKIHLSEHRDMMQLPSASPYKMMSPVRKFSNASLSPPGERLPSYSKDSEEFGSSNMCGTCGKCFRDSQSLKFHRYNHVLRYQCNFCGKRFSRSWNLHRHRKTHYRQLHDGSVGSDPVSAIDVDNDRMEGKIPPFTIDVDNHTGMFRPGNVEDAAIKFAPYTVGSNNTSKSSVFGSSISGILDYSSYAADGRKSSEPIPLTIEAGKTMSSEAGMDKSSESVSNETQDMPRRYSMAGFDKAESPHGEMDMSDSS